MPLIAVDSPDDPRLDVYRRLKTTNAGRDARAFVVEGPKLVERLLASSFPVLSLVVDESRAEEMVRRVPDDVPIYVLSRGLLRELIGYEFHQGVLGCGRRGSPRVLADLISDPAPIRTIVVCPVLDNPENLGAILRLADVFDVEAVLVGPSCPDPLSRRVLRVSMGFALWRPVLVLPDLIGACRRLREAAGFSLWGAVATEGAVPFDSFPRPDRLALVLGRESSGLDDDWLATIDRPITIPMRPGAESLNVAVAAGVLLYHFQRGWLG
jgi:tRNA G18 (ribose-2'-O)-methylase SpoU